MKITVGKPTLVYQGGRPEELHWGFVQFPWLYNTADGNILIAIHCEDDAPFAIDGGKSYLKSTDGGKSWVAATAEDVARIISVAIDSTSPTASTASSSLIPSSILSSIISL